MSLRPPPRRFLWVWALAVAAFYAAWLALVVGMDGGFALVAQHWPIALAMLFGGYVAGSTPMGGGTVGFPLLVLAFGLPTTLGRDFSFAIQSVGMTSASLFLLCRRQPLAWAMLQGCLLGSALALPVGLFVIAPLVPQPGIKLAFAVLWAAFGILHLLRLREISSRVGMTEFDERWDFRAGFATGAAAGLTVVPVTGVGVDMLLYAVLVLVCRADLKIAIPTSVVAMAFNSLLGSAIKLVGGGFEPGVFGNWLAAAPVVVLGAPLGALVVSHIDRRPTLLLVSLLCIGQFIWACHTEWAALGPAGIAGACAAVAGLLGIFEKLRARGAALGAGAPPPGR